MRYFILAPENLISGGPELAHQMCCELSENGCTAFMYYISDGHREPVDIPAPKPYLGYQTAHETKIENVEQPDTVVIFNEGSTTYIPAVSCGRKILWWMSVDNYKAATQQSDLDIIREQICLHLVQSQYAYEYVKNEVGISEENILFVADYINEQYGRFVLPAKYRQNIALYNPKKGYADMEPLIQSAPWLRWIPLINLNTEQIVVLMQSAKVYVDFGGHPGKDRIPREAAASGCCVVTNKKGSAANDVDVPIPEKYKFADVPSQYEEIKALLADICKEFERHSAEFDSYRKVIGEERGVFAECVRRFVGVVENMI